MLTKPTAYLIDSRNNFTVAENIKASLVAREIDFKEIDFINREGKSKMFLTLTPIKDEPNLHLYKLHGDNTLEFDNRILGKLVTIDASQLKPNQVHLRDVTNVYVLRS